MAKYLDEAGLKTLWGQIKANFVTDGGQTIEYDKMSKKVILKGKEGTELSSFDATDFIKDGFLNNITIVTVTDGQMTGEGILEPKPSGLPNGKYIQFKWNTDSGISDMYIDIADLGISFTEGEAITISGEVIDVKIAETGNFIKKDAEGLKVEGMDANVTVTTADIPVAGGPLADLVKSVYPEGIKKGANLQEVFMNLLCKEKYPKVSVTPGSISSAFDAPSISIAQSGTVEVGTDIEIPALTGYEPKSNPVARKYSGFTYGWSAADDDTKDSDGNPANVDVTEITLSAGEFTVSRTYNNGFTGGTPASNSNAAAASATIEGEIVKVAEGANKVTFTISGPGHSGKVAASPEYFAISNLGNTEATQKTEAQGEQILEAKPASNGTKVISLTGNYKYFFGYSAKMTGFNSDEIRALGVKNAWISTSGDTTIIGTDAITSDGTNIIIAVPSTYRVKTIQGGLGNDMLSTCKEMEKVQVNTGSIQTEYTVYAVGTSAPLEVKNITVGK